MFTQFKNVNFYLVALADLVLFALSLLLANAVRFNFEIPLEEYNRTISILPWVLLTKSVTFFAFGAYRGMWRYTSVTDALRLFKAATLSLVVVVFGLTYWSRFNEYPRSVFLADWVFTMFLTGGLRMGIRMSVATIARRLPQASLLAASAAGPAKTTRLIILGAGDAADKIIREIASSPMSNYKVICCLDDSPAKKGMSIHGIPVRGPVERLAYFVEQYDISEALIAMPSATSEEMRRVVQICEATKIRFKTIPSITSLIDGRVTISALRDVNYEDLLGRPQVNLDTEQIGHYLRGKRVAITGAGGSIGSELCRQIARFAPSDLLLIDSSEFNLYSIEAELTGEKLFAQPVPLLGQVQDADLIKQAFAKFKPQVVFHAAARKHVPMVELNPWEAVTNNIVGSDTVMNLAEQAGVERFVLISTDKAVRPTNVMGASKRAAEILLQTRPGSSTQFMAVRFGNVVGSSGSVIPMFQRQIQAGGPITVTHPDITRYFMTIPEACQLVLQAGAMGQGGEIFILEMGTPVKIADMARDLIRLSGKEPDRDIRIVYSGLRPGEKLHEELITHGEGIQPTRHDKIMVLKREGPETVLRGQFTVTRDAVARLQSCAARFDAAGIKSTLHEIVPEYTPSSSRSVLDRQ